MGVIRCRSNTFKRIIYYLTHNVEAKTVHTFPEDISPIVDVIAWLEFALIYFQATVQNSSQYVVHVSNNNNIKNNNDCEKNQDRFLAVAIEMDREKLV